MLSTVLAAGIFLAVPLIVVAYSARTGTSVIVPKSESLDDTLYAAGQTVTVDGDVNGDVVCAGQTVVINGNVSGSVLSASNSLMVNGDVAGSVRAVGSSIILNGNVEKNVMAFGATVEQESGKSIGWGMLVGAGSANILGSVGRSLYGAASQATISGNIGRNVDLVMDGYQKGGAGLVITKDARINGDVKYTSRADADIAQGAQIQGEVSRKAPIVKEKEAEKGISPFLISLMIIFLLGAILVGLVASFAFPVLTREITDNMFSRIPASLGWGALATILAPLIAIFLTATLVGIPLALIIMALWFIGLYLSQIFTGILIGRIIFGKRNHTRERSLIWSAIIGVAIAWILFYIPLIGWLLSLLAVFWGIGGIWVTAFRRDYRETDRADL